MSRELEHVGEPIDPHPRGEPAESLAAESDGSCVIAGNIGVLRLDINEPISDVRIQLRSLRLRVHVSGEELGVLEMPVVDGLLRADVLRDAIADRFAWPILQKFFERQIYANCAFRIEGQSCSAWYRRSCIARGLPVDPKERSRALHDIAGWQLFLQEIWNTKAALAMLRRLWRGLTNPWRKPSSFMLVEASEPCPHVAAQEDPIQVILTVGGSPLGVFALPVTVQGLRGQELRQFLIDAAGFELCRIAVREALVGRSWAERRSLRERLIRQHARRKSASPSLLRAENAHCLVPGWEQAVGELAGNTPLLLIGRRVGAIGSSASRLYALPESVRARLLEVEQRHDTPIIHANTPQSAPLIYAPTLLTRTDAAIPSSQLNPHTAVSSVRHDFESLFARGADPWHYDSAYEQRKYEQTLSLVPRPPVERALELACAEGHFTRHLAPHVKQLLATDISEIALQRAAQRCQSSTNVEFQTLDLASDQLPRDLDLIVCSEMLYFVGDLEALRATAQKIAGALRAGGVFITAHARVVSDESDATGYAWDMPFGAATIIDVFSSTAPLRLVRELRTPLYRIALFEAGTIGHDPPEVTKVNFELPLPEIAAQIVWSATPQQTALVSRHPQSSPAPTHLPILMYHHVAPTGDAARTRYRVHPDALEAQLRYLRDCGFTSVGLEGWRDVVEGRSKHPARPVLLTFDDAYVDFEEYAWPLLRRYGFSAALFVVAGTVGGSNRWDKDASDERLLDWLALRRLHEQGVTIGAHSVTHPRMTGLPTSEIARELIESRASLERELGVAVRTFAYPFGDEDEVVQHLTGAAGYLHGLSCRPGHPATRRDSWLALPRIEVTGFDDLPSFIAKLAP